MKTSGFNSKSANIDKTKIHYAIGGSGPAVVLLHGFAETSRMWGPILPALAAKFTVIAPDLPGIGDSSIPTDGASMKRAAIQIHDLVRSLGIEKARIVGHDIGLMVAYAYAALFPSDTEKLVVMEFRAGSQFTTRRTIGTFGSTDRRQKLWSRDAKVSTSLTFGMVLRRIRIGRYRRQIGKHI
jgi:pimeloyl-ACP methyl ester carboxylesterase